MEISDRIYIGLVLFGYAVIALLLVFLITTFTNWIDAKRHKNETKEEREIRKAERKKRREERERLINWQLLCWGMQIVFVIFISLLCGSIIKLNATFSVKYIIFFGFAIGVLLLIKFYEILNNQTEILEYLKKTFISLEMQRIEPDDKTPASEIIAKSEEGIEILEEAVGGIMPKLIYYTGWGIYIIGTILFTYLFVTNWDYISNMDIIDEIKNIFNDYWSR